MSSLLTFTTWDKPVNCSRDELAIFDPPANQTCGDYLSAYQQGMGVGTERARIARLFQRRQVGGLGLEGVIAGLAMLAAALDEEGL